MHHATLNSAQAVTNAGIHAILSSEAAHLMARSSAVEAQLVLALDRTYGEQGWFLYWDEDLTGHPIRGTMTLCFGGETLVVG